jgi:hypothetical protein
MRQSATGQKPQHLNFGVLRFAAILRGALRPVTGEKVPLPFFKSFRLRNKKRVDDPGALP